MSLSLWSVEWSHYHSTGPKHWVFYGLRIGPLDRYLEGLPQRVTTDELLQRDDIDAFRLHPMTNIFLGDGPMYRETVWSTPLKERWPALTFWPMIVRELLRERRRSPWRLSREGALDFGGDFGRRKTLASTTGSTEGAAFCV